MSKALSVDLRERVLIAVGSDLSHRDSGERCRVSTASVSLRWALQGEMGQTLSKCFGRDRRSGRIETLASLIRSLI